MSNRTPGGVRSKTPLAMKSPATPVSYSLQSETRDSESRGIGSGRTPSNRSRARYDGGEGATNSMNHSMDSIPLSYEMSPGPSPLKGRRTGVVENLRTLTSVAMDPRQKTIMVSGKKAAKEFVDESQRMDLTNLHLQVVPSHIVMLSPLRVLILQQNQLTGLPSDLPEGLPNLTILNIRDNYFESLPQLIGRFRHLNTLLATKNRLKQLPPCVGQLPLRMLDVAENDLVDLPLSLSGTMTSLTCLEVHNQDRGLKFPPLEIQRKGAIAMTRFLCDVLLAQKHAYLTNALDLSGIPHASPTVPPHKAPRGDNDDGGDDMDDDVDDGDGDGKIGENGDRRGSVGWVDGNGRSDRDLVPKTANGNTGYNGNDASTGSSAAIAKTPKSPSGAQWDAIGSPMSPSLRPSSLSPPPPVPHRTGPDYVHVYIRQLVGGIVAMDLSRTKLRIVPDFKLFPQLAEIILDDNELVAALVPPLHGLQSLSIQRNHLTSLTWEPTPPPSLQTLLLDDNNLASVPGQVEDVRSLTTLSIAGNKLTAVVSVNVRGLVMMRTLYLQRNSISLLELPSRRLRSLTDVDLSNNAIAEVPMDMFHLTTLARLMLNDNPLRSIPNNLGNLTMLKELGIAGCPLDIMPGVWGSMTRIEALHFDGAQLKIPPQRVIRKGLANAQKFVAAWHQSHETFSLTLQKFSLRAVPPEVFTTTLTDLSLACNHLKAIPEAIADLTNLASLSVHDNRITAIPDFVFNIMLTSLDVSKNQLKDIPDVIGRVTTLRELTVTENPDIMVLPAGIATLTKLTFLGLDVENIFFPPKQVIEAGLAGTLAFMQQAFSNQSGTVDLRGKGVDALMAASLGTPGMLKVLLLDHNHLNASNQCFPDMVMSRHSHTLHTISLSFNPLRFVPAMVCRLPHLVSLNLRGCQIEHVHGFISVLTNLTLLDMGANEIAFLPAELAQLANLRGLVLDKNHFLAVPPPLCAPDDAPVDPSDVFGPFSLELLVLSGNDITHLPTSITRLQRLSALHLDQNRIRHIPTGIGFLSSLTDIRLHGNPVGNLPIDLGRLYPRLNMTLSIENLTYPPKGVLRGGPATIMRFLNSVFWAGEGNLDLSDMLLVAVPALLLRSSALLNLRKLIMNGCDVGDIPSDLSKFEKLETISFEDNRLVNVPDELLQLTGLRELLLRGNKINAVRVEYGGMHCLIHFDVRDNPVMFPPAFVTSRGGIVTADFLRSLFYARRSQILDLGGSVEAADEIDTAVAERTAAAGNVGADSDDEIDERAAAAAEEIAAQVLRAAMGNDTTSYHPDRDESMGIAAGGAVIRQSDVEAIGGQTIDWVQVAPLDWMQTRRNATPPPSPKAVAKALRRRRQKVQKQAEDQQKAEQGGSVVLAGSRLFVSQLQVDADTLTSLTTLSLSHNKMTNRQLGMFVSAGSTAAMARNLLWNVTDLNLSGNKLSSLPQTMNQCTALTSLDVSNNFFQVLPDCCTQLVALETFDCTKNPLKIVPLSLGLLVNLRAVKVTVEGLEQPAPQIAARGAEALYGYMHQYCMAFSRCSMGLSGLALTEMPSELALLSTLTDLDMSENAVTVVPEWASYLTFLQTLNLRRNRLGPEFPSVLGRCWALTSINASHNQLSSVPEEIAWLTHLKALNLGHNQFESIPDVIYHMMSLCDLRLHGNRIDDIPRIVSKLTSITTLKLHDNAIKHLPVALGACNNLQRLQVRNNPIKNPPPNLAWDRDRIPSDVISELVREHKKTETRLVGTDAALELLARLHTGEVAYAAHTAGLFHKSDDRDKELPSPANATTANSSVLSSPTNATASSSIAAATAAANQISRDMALDLSGFTFTSVPREVYKLRHLVRFSCCGASLETISPEITTLPKLRELLLSSNQLSSLPLEMGSMTGLRVLDVSDNPLQRPPSEVIVQTTPVVMSYLQHLSEMPTTGRLRMEDFHLKEIPPELYECASLTSVSVAHNAIEKVSGRIQLLDSLSELRLDFNKLRDLPDGVCNLPYLRLLSVEGNKLRELPEGVDRLSSLTHINAKYNEVKHLPDGLGFCLGLHSLLLEGNPLAYPPLQVVSQGGRATARFVRQVSTSTVTRVLDISRFNLTKLPKEVLDRVHGLTMLNLDRNGLLEVPDEIASLTSLTLLSLQYNNVRRLPPQLLKLTCLHELRTFGNPLLGFASERFEHVRDIAWPDGQVDDKGVARDEGDNSDIEDLAAPSHGPGSPEWAAHLKGKPLKKGVKGPVNIDAPQVDGPVDANAINPAGGDSEAMPDAGGEAVQEGEAAEEESESREVPPGHWVAGAEAAKEFGHDVNEEPMPEWTSQAGVEGPDDMQMPLLGILERLKQANVQDRIDLSDMHLSSMPPVVSDMQAVQTLILRRNRIIALPPDIGKMRLVTHLDCSANRLRELPTAIGFMQSLNRLWLQHNNLIKLPHQIGKLKRLVQIQLFANPDLFWLPLGLRGCESLMQLIMDQPQGSWMFPPYKVLERGVQPHAHGPTEILGRAPGGEVDEGEEPPPTDYQEHGFQMGDPQLIVSYMEEYQSRLVDANESDALDLSHLSLLVPHLPAVPTLLELDRGIQIVGLDPSTIFSLDISGNGLTRLFDQLEQFSRLTALSMTHNKLEDLGPVVGTLTSLQSMSLSNNRLKVLPQELGLLPHLSKLDLSSNLLEDLPEEIKQLTALLDLNLDSNGLKTLPVAVCALLLFQLSLENNNMETLPDAICTMGRLTVLRLGGNKFVSLPHDLGRLPKLKQLYLLDNPHLKAVPLSLGHCTTLEEMPLDFNAMRVPPREVHLQGLDVTRQLLRGVLKWQESREETARRKAEEALALGEHVAVKHDGHKDVLAVEDDDDDTDMSLVGMGIVMLTLGVLSHLRPRSLIIDGNGLKNLNLDLVQWENLSRLSLRENNLDSLPIMANYTLTTLKDLDLGQNKFTTLADGFFWMRGLTKLNLEHNAIATLPPAVSRLVNLRRLDLNHNELTGLPDLFGRLSSLAMLSIAHNKFQSFPMVLLACGGLTALYLSNNNVPRVPCALVQLTNLETLDLEWDLVHGIPHQIHCRGLSNIMNYLGRVQKALSDTILDIPSFLLEDVPCWASGYRNLTQLILDDNCLRKLPNWISLLHNLGTLSANNNALETIDGNAVAALTSLRRLHLANNRLQALPASIANLSSLTSIDITENPTLQSPPPEVATKSTMTVMMYLASLVADVVKLDFRNLELVEVPKCCLDVIGLHTLSLDHNEIVSLPMNLPTSLVELTVSHNHLRELSETLTRLQNLEHLDVSENPELHVIPLALATVPNLQKIVATEAYIVSPPPEVLRAGAGSLRDFLGRFREAANCKATGQEHILNLSSLELSLIPPDVFAVDNLQGLVISKNPLTNIAGNGRLNSLFQLTSLDISDTGVRELPNELAELHRLSWLACAGNEWEVVPPVVWNLSRLQTLNLTRNVLKSIGDLLAFLPAMKSLRLDNNNLEKFPSLSDLDYADDEPEETEEGEGKKDGDTGGHISLVDHGRNGGGDDDDGDDRDSQATDLDNSLDGMSDGGRGIGMPKPRARRPSEDGEPPPELASILAAVGTEDGNDDDGDGLVIPTMEDAPGPEFGIDSFDPIASLKRKAIQKPMTEHARDYDAEQVDALYRCVGSLTELTMNNNKVEVVPPSLGYCVHLDKLEADGNQIVALPPQMSRLTNLKIISMEHNRLVHVPYWLAALDELPELRFRGNPLHPAMMQALGAGTLGRVVSECNKGWWARSVDISSCGLAEIPSDVLSNPSIIQLVLTDNSLGSLPPELAGLAMLESLSVDSVKLTTCPPEIGQLKYLKMLNMNNNRMSELPAEIGLLRQLTELHVASNELVGLPTTVNDLENLTQLSASANRLMTLPADMSNMTGMNNADFADNRLQSFPTTACLGWVRLQRLSLRGNSLQTLPANLHLLTALNTLLVSDNQLTGLPLSLGSMSSLTRLEVGNNTLSPTMTDVLRSNLIPGVLRYLQALHAVNETKVLHLTEFAFNRFPIDVLRLGGANGLREAQLAAASLGTGQLADVATLDLSHNHLTRIPDISFLSSLTCLRASVNRIDMIDDSLATITTLRELDLSDNRLEIVPRAIVDLLGLKVLRLLKNPLRALPTREWETHAQFETLHLDNETWVDSKFANGRVLVPLECCDGGEQGPTEYLRHLMRAGRTSELDLSELGLFYVPSQALSMQGLTKLFLSGNFLRNLPPTLGNALPGLVELVANNNFLTMLPESLRELTKLTRLSVICNKLTRLPAEVGAITNLQQLDANENPLQVPPTVIAKQSATIVVRFLRSLLLSRESHQLDLSELAPNESLHLEPVDYQGLQSLTLRMNEMTRVSKQLCDIRSLTYLDLSRNKLVDLPLTFKQFSALQVLRLDDNNFSVYPSILYSMPWINELHFANNQIRVLPAEIIQQVELKVLTAPRNTITTIDPQLAFAVALVELDVSFNPIQDMPTALRKLAGWHNELLQFS